MNTTLTLDDTLAAAVMRLPGVRDCAVIRRTTTAGAAQYVAYVVPVLPFDPAKFDAAMGGMLLNDVRLDAWVPVTSLPVEQDGTVDAESLAALEVLDADVVRQWNSALGADDGKRQVAIQPALEETGRLHLWDLAPGFRDFGAPAPQASVRPTPADVPDSSRRPALADGGPLADPLARTLVDVLLATAARYPERGMMYESSHHALDRHTYQELADDARRVCAGLRKAGVRPGDPIIVQCDAHREFLTGFWGSVLAGAIAVPASIPPTYSQENAALEKLRNVWHMMGRPFVLCTQRLERELSQLSRTPSMADLRTLLVDDLRSTAPDSPHEGHPDDVALMLLTSGSTGRPKAVMLTHRNLIARSTAMADVLRLSDADVALNWFPLDHVGGLVMYHVIFVLSGSDQVHAPTEMIVENPIRWLELLHRHRVTNTWSPNFGYALVNARAGELDGRSLDLSRLRTIVNGGEAVVPETARKFMAILARFGVPPEAMQPSWGMSETSSGITIAQGLHEPMAGFVDVGAPIPGVQLRIVDGAGNLVDEGVAGRLQVRGDAITPGYYENPEQNAESFATGWFETGDLALLSNGHLTITGRTKDVIIVNGVNYYSHEIEAIVDSVPGVDVSYTAAFAVRMANDVSDRICIVFHPSVDAWAEQLSVIDAVREAVTERMGLRPSFVVPVRREEVPKTAIGKIQRSLLRQQFDSGQFDATIKRIDLAMSSQSTVPNWFFTPQWSPRARRGIAPDQASCALIFADTKGLAAAIHRRIAADSCVYVERGARFERVNRFLYRIDPKAPADYKSLFTGLASDGIDIDQVLHLWSYGRTRAALDDGAAVADAQHDGAYSIVHTAQQLASSQPRRRVSWFVVSSNAQLVTGTEPVAYEMATLLGVWRSVAVEMPSIDCRHVDMDGVDVQSDADCLASEMSVAKAPLEIAYRSGRRFEAGLRPVNIGMVPVTEDPIRQSGLYLVTGGLGGVGTVLSEYLSRRYGAKLLLLGRPQTALRDRAYGDRRHDRNRRRLDANGVDYVSRSVDLNDVEALREAVFDAERHWNRPISGIFHLAGEGNLERHWNELDHHFVRSESIDTFEENFVPKVYGTLNLFTLIEHRPDVLFVGFSSVLSLFGGATSAAYAAANSFLDCYCRFRRRSSHPRTFCFNWSAWANTGMNEDAPQAVSDAFEGMGYAAMSPTHALSSMAAALSRDLHELAIGLDPSSPHVQQHLHTPLSALVALSAELHNAGSDAGARVRAVEVRDRFGVRTTCRVATGVPGRIGSPSGFGAEKRREERLPKTEVEVQIAKIWREVLAVPTLTVDDRFFELGGDSLLGMRVVNRLRETFGINMSLRSLFEMPTVASMAVAIGAHDRPARIVVTPDTEEAQLRADVDALSDREVEALLSQLLPEGPAS